MSSSSCSDPCKGRSTAPRPNQAHQRGSEISQSRRKRPDNAENLTRPNDRANAHANGRSPPVRSHQLRQRAGGNRKIGRMEMAYAVVFREAFAASASTRAEIASKTASLACSIDAMA